MFSNRSYVCSSRTFDKCILQVIFNSLRLPAFNDQQNQEYRPAMIERCTQENYCNSTKQYVLLSPKNIAFPFLSYWQINFPIILYIKNKNSFQSINKHQRDSKLFPRIQSPEAFYSLMHFQSNCQSCIDAGIFSTTRRKYLSVRKACLQILSEQQSRRKSS